MKVVVAGGTGFIGKRLVTRLVEDGHDCTVLIRSPHSPPADFFPNEVRLSPYASMPNAADAVINLGGETVVGRWTKAKKDRILDSRIGITRDLVKWMGGLKKKPSVFLSGSAVGYYGDRGSDTITEDAAPDPKKGFRAQVCIMWEQEALEARRMDIRVVTLRTGNVLDPSGGMLGKMIPSLRIAPFILPYARDAFLPWISLRDTVGIVSFVLKTESVSGPVNLVAPTPATIGEFFNDLGSILHKKVVGTLPRWPLKLVLGEFSKALTDSQRVIPEKIVYDGYAFQDIELGEYLRQVVILPEKKKRSA